MSNDISIQYIVQLVFLMGELHIVLSNEIMQENINYDTNLNIIK